MKIAFVIPWYGKDIPGGAESACRSTAVRLKAAGLDVEVLTTCVKDSYGDWGVDFHKEGIELIDGVTVRRFPARKRDTKRFDAVNKKLIAADLSQLRLRRAEDPGASPLFGNEEGIYIEEMVNSPALYDFIERKRDAFDFFIFIPYMFGTTYFGARSAGRKAVLMPCLHDESYAYLRLYRDMFRGAGGIFYNAKAEERLAARLYGEGLRGVTTGVGMETEAGCGTEGFTSKYGVSKPYILYAGRKDPGKNTPLLIDYFRRYRDKNPDSPLNLVLIGSGSASIPSGYGGYMKDLGFMNREDKFGAYAGAVALCQPSVNESFSIVVMESWVAGTPVLVHGGCEVTREFCDGSGGGLYFTNFAEFAESVDFFLNNEDDRRAMGRGGQRFVKSNFNWDTVTARIIGALKEWNGIED